MKTVALAGAAGYVGSQIARAVIASGRYHLIPVLRTDPAETLFSNADIVVHAANPSRRFQAEKDPMHDFKETVEKTARFFTLAQGKRFVLVSTISCRTQLNTNYGRNRRACELIVLGGNSLVVRLGPMFGSNRTKDTLHDIIANRQVYVSAETQYAYVDVAWAGKKIVELLEETGKIIEVGARNSIRLGDLSEHFASTSTFSGIDDTQIPEGFSDGPDVQEVYHFAETEKTRIYEWK
jgi:nucleoside-diphosphate-sugar epimerase